MSRTFKVVVMVRYRIRRAKLVANHTIFALGRFPSVVVPCMLFWSSVINEKTTDSKCAALGVRMSRAKIKYRGNRDLSGNFLLSARNADQGKLDVVSVIK